MEIDIISYTEEQYALLSEAQLQEVRAAQIKKNKLAKKLKEDKQKAKAKLINNGVFFSKMWELIQAELEEDYDAEVNWLRQSLLFFLHYSSKSDSMAPYPLDYALSEEERLAVVREYYESTYKDDAERLKAFEADNVVKSYLGELYKPLHDYYKELANY